MGSPDSLCSIIVLTVKLVCIKMGGEIALMMFETDSGNTCYWLSIIMAFVLILYLINTELYFTFI